MLIFSIFAISAGTYMVVYSVSGNSPILDATFGVLAIGSAIGIALIPLLVAVEWFNGTTGLTNLMLDSWKSLSGVSSPSHLTGCEHVAGGNANPNGLVIVTFAFTIVAFFTAMFAIIAPFAGAVLTLFGLIPLIGSQGKDLYRFKQGLMLLTCGLGAIVAAGLLFRIIRALTVASCT